MGPGGTLIVVEWDKSMVKPWQFAEDDLMSPAEIAALLPGVTIEKAAVCRVENPHREYDPKNLYANIALVRAYR